MKAKARRRAARLIRPAACVVFLLMFGLAAFGQTASGAATAKPAGSAASYAAASQLYQRGRQLQMAGKEAEAEKMFASSLGMVEKLLPSDSSNADLVSLQCWNLFRLERHKEVVAIAQKALGTIKDFRIMETMAESLYFLDRNEEALRYFAKYGLVG